MAKGSPFWGKQKGKLGETVLAVVKGQQIQRAYNAEPANPRSNKQTAQRIVFANAVKFFKSAIASQFKFAYEDKKQTESDYNAFMRHNVKNGMILTRSQYLNPKFPSLGEFIVADGSLPEATSNMGQAYQVAVFNLDGTFTEAPSKLQDIARGLAARYGLQDGDIITIVQITSDAKTINDACSSRPTWEVLQIKVGDTADQRTTGDAPTNMTLQTTTSTLAISMGNTTAGGCTIIFSRPTPNGLLVSPARIWYNEPTQNILNASQAPAYIANAKTSWGMGTASLLEGSKLPNV